MATAPPEVSEKDLQRPIAERDDEAYQLLSNEAGRRVWVVLQNLIEVRGRTRKEGALHGLEVQAILMGAMSGIACHVARMSLSIDNPTPDAPPPEVLMLNDLGNQFMHTIEQMRASDPLAMMMAGAKDGEKAS